MAKTTMFLLDNCVWLCARVSLERILGVWTLVCVLSLLCKYSLCVLWVCVCVRESVCENIDWLNILIKPDLNVLSV